MLNFSYFFGILLNLKGNKDYKDFYAKLLIESNKGGENTICSLDPESKYISINNSVSGDQIDSKIK